MRLHNRQIKATFWNDPDLLQWPREKRWFYAGLVQLADDSGCVEDSPFAFKVNLFPSPLDADIAVDTLARWRDELIQQKKVVAYVVDGRPCLFLANFHKHQTIEKPNGPSKTSIPLPPWIEWVQGETRRTSHYIVRDVSLPMSGQCPDSGGVEPQPQPQPKPINPPTPLAGATETRTPKRRRGPLEYTPEFEEFWAFYPRLVGKQAAMRKWMETLNRPGSRDHPRATSEMLIQAARNYAAEREDEPEKYTKHPETFLGPDEHWRDYVQPRNKPKGGKPDGGAKPVGERTERDYIEGYEGHFR